LPILLNNKNSVKIIIIITTTKITIMQSSTGIHCKVACNNQFRRFLFVGTEFSSLYCQVKCLLNLNEKEFVLKYKDNEGDMITISSDEELSCALSLSNGSLLRLSASFPSTEAEKQSADIPVSCEFETPGAGFHGRCPRRFGRGHHGGRGGWHSGPRCGPYERMHMGSEDGARKPWRRDCRKAKLTYKREVIQSILNELAQCAERGELRPDQLRKQDHLKTKLCNIDRRLQELNDDKMEEQCDKPMENDKCQKEEEKCQDKCQKEEEKCRDKCQKEEKSWDKCKNEKQRRKCEKKSRKECERNWHKEKRCHKPLSDEVKAEIEEVKASIATLKQPLREIKVEIKNKKQAWREANEHDAQLIACEIADLKKQSMEYKKQIQPLRQRIREMYHGARC